MLNFSIKKVGENKYVGTMTGGIPNASYTMQMKFVPPVINDWGYAGAFVADSFGKVVTFEFGVPNPNSEYPYMFRFLEDISGQVSNEITIGSSGIGLNFNIGLAIIAIIAFIIGIFIIRKKVK